MQVRKILVPLDDTPASRRALEYATLLGRRFAARIDLLHCWGPVDYVVPEAMIDVEVGHKQPDVVHHADFAYGDPCQAIIEAARAGDHDLIVMGTSTSGHWDWLRRSVALEVVRRAHCPVITLHAADGDAGSDSPTRHDASRSSGSF